MRSAEIYYRDRLAGWLTEIDAGYQFKYSPEYLELPDSKPVSLTMPLREAPYKSNVLFPCFDCLIPDGWLLDVATKSGKIDPKDRLGLLLTCCKECIGALSVVPQTIE